MANWSHKLRCWAALQSQAGKWGACTDMRHACIGGAQCTSIPCTLNPKPYYTLDGARTTCRARTSWRQSSPTLKMHACTRLWGASSLLPFSSTWAQHSTFGLLHLHPQPTHGTPAPASYQDMQSTPAAHQGHAETRQLIGSYIGVLCMLHRVSSWQRGHTQPRKVYLPCAHLEGHQDGYFGSALHGRG